MKYLANSRLRMMIAVLTAGMALCSSCTNEHDDDQEKSYADFFMPQGDFQEMTGTYKGIWAVEGRVIDTLSISLFFDGNTYIAFYGFPYEAFVRQFCPDVDDYTVTDSAPLGIQLVKEEAFWLKTLVAYGDDSVCLENYLGVPINNADYSVNNKCYSMNNIGYSEQMVYYELPAVRGAAFRYLPFVVTPSNGDYFALVTYIVPGSSIVSIYHQLGVVTCQLVVSQADIVDQQGNVTKCELPSDMLLTFTSMEKI